MPTYTMQVPHFDVAKKAIARCTRLLSVNRPMRLIQFSGGRYDMDSGELVCDPVLAGQIADELHRLNTCAEPSGSIGDVDGD